MDEFSKQSNPYWQNLEDKEIAFPETMKVSFIVIHLCVKFPMRNKHSRAWQSGRELKSWSSNAVRLSLGCGLAFAYFTMLLQVGRRVAAATKYCTGQSS